jgi:hypothetical protein
MVICRRSSNRAFTFSYGEYVETFESIDYKTGKRAEKPTAFHLSLKDSGPREKLNIVNREWFYRRVPISP